MSATVLKQPRLTFKSDHRDGAGQPWQNAYVDRLMGSVRRECLDHPIILGPDHLRRIMRGYVAYYNDVRPHLSLNKEAPRHRRICTQGSIQRRPHLGGLHHEYVRI